MNTLIIHPRDKTTRTLCRLYDDMKDFILIEGGVSNKDIRRILSRQSHKAPLYLLGHGSDKGLFYRQDDSSTSFDGTIIDHRHRYYLQDFHGIVAIFCHADLWMKSLGLHGLCTSMVISSVEEGLEYGINVEQEVMDKELDTMFTYLRHLINSGTAHHLIPQMMSDYCYRKIPLNEFNYNSFRYL